MVVTKLMCWLAIAILAAPGTEKPKSSPPPKPKFPRLADVQQAVEEALDQTPGLQPRDLISQSQVVNALNAVQKLGWDIPDRQEITNDSLPDSHVMVATFKTPKGQRFMRQVASREMIYDRLDRISQVAGGPRLIEDIVKLPDGERYAKPRSGGGVPDLLDLLPKNASGQTRKIKDYDRPTGRIYTSADLLDRIRESHRKAEQQIGAGAGKASGKSAP